MSGSRLLLQGFYPHKGANEVHLEGPDKEAYEEAHQKAHQAPANEKTHEVRVEGPRQILVQGTH